MSGGTPLRGFRLTRYAVRPRSSTIAPSARAGGDVLNSETVRIGELMEESGVGFGTSGARGLVTDMTDRVCYAYTAAFIQHLQTLGKIEPGAAIAVAGDLRVSTERIMNAVAKAIAAKKNC